jgi:hypothetical protein
MMRLSPPQAAHVAAQKENRERRDLDWDRCRILLPLGLSREVLAFTPRTRAVTVRLIYTWISESHNC